MSGPDALELRMLLGRVQSLSDEHWRLLSGPRQAMADHAWVGGASAAGFAARLEDAERRLQAQLARAVQLLRDKSNMPAF
ncbi:hypothetical protein DZF91_35215 [Actinomadura logoneensis]|uniref:Uncharacterized protein n=1 Tax=Actinomadura logoneensis TaxID=2293572 RepID=A0A372JAE6_9ACTN|nr:hypothetical protein [Actinomadura logoneensis]RFU36995.1 hypothetical protein DZF91_35215 [Actinomadura logoneensis]